MSAAQSETFSPSQIGLLCGLLLLAVFLGEVVFPTHGNKDAMAESMDTMEDIAMRLTPVVVLEDMHANAMSVAAAGDIANKTPAELYNGACMACHSTGAAGAPKLGDLQGWKARFSRGLDSLTAAAIKGVGGMPPRGGSQYTDEQIRAVVEYIQAESQ